MCVYVCIYIYIYIYYVISFVRRGPRWPLGGLQAIADHYFDIEMSNQRACELLRTFTSTLKCAMRARNILRTSMFRQL